MHELQLTRLWAWSSGWATTGARGPEVVGGGKDGDETGGILVFVLQPEGQCGNPRWTRTRLSPSGTAAAVDSDIVTANNCI